MNILDTTTLETLRPRGYHRPLHITAEYMGSRYLITHTTGWIEAEANRLRLRPRVRWRGIFYWRRLRLAINKRQRAGFPPRI